MFNHRLACRRFIEGRRNREAQRATERAQADTITKTRRRTSRLSTVEKTETKVILKILFLLMPAGLFSQDSAGVYDINDPRNPNCPCHKHQELAEKEYREIIAGNISLAATANTTVYTSGSSSGDGASQISSFKKSGKKIRRKFNKIFLSKNNSKQRLYSVRKGKFLVCR